MKKIFYITAAVIISLMLCFSASALETVEADVTEAVVETVEIPATETEERVETNDAEIVTEEVESETPPTIFTRLWEYVNIYKTELLDVLGTAIIVILSVIIKLKGDKKTTNIDKLVQSIKGDTASQGQVVSVVNEMVDGYNALRCSYDKYGLTEDDRNRVVGALVAQNTAILEILMALTVNNKNLPQGAKDLVLLQYANCLKSLDDDEKLKSIVTSVRDSIGTNKLTEGITEESEGSEV